MKYQITYKGKSRTIQADDANDAMQKFSARKVFGQRLFLKWSTNSIDADTRGQEWGVFNGYDNDNHAHRVEIETIN